MTIKDLKTGMIVVTRKWGKFIVIKDTCFVPAIGNNSVTDVIWREPGSWMDLEGYDDNFKLKVMEDDALILNLSWTEEETKKNAMEWDIVAVLDPGHPSCLTMKKSIESINDMKILWTEKEGDIEDETIMRYMFCRDVKSEEILQSFLKEEY